MLRNLVQGRQQYEKVARAVLEFRVMGKRFVEKCQVMHDIGE